MSGGLKIQVKRWSNNNLMQFLFCEKRFVPKLASSIGGLVRGGDESTWVNPFWTSPQPWIVYQLKSYVTSHNSITQFAHFCVLCCGVFTCTPQGELVPNWCVVEQSHVDGGWKLQITWYVFVVAVRTGKGLNFINSWCKFDKIWKRKKSTKREHCLESSACFGLEHCKRSPRHVTKPTIFMKICSHFVIFISFKSSWRTWQMFAAWATVHSILCWIPRS